MTGETRRHMRYDTSSSRVETEAEAEAEAEGTRGGIPYWKGMIESNQVRSRPKLRGPGPGPGEMDGCRVGRALQECKNSNAIMDGHIGQSLGSLWRGVEQDAVGWLELKASSGMIPINVNHVNVHGLVENTAR